MEPLKIGSARAVDLGNKREVLTSDTYFPDGVLCDADRALLASVKAVEGEEDAHYTIDSNDQFTRIRDFAHLVSTAKAVYAQFDFLRAEIAPVITRELAHEVRLAREQRMTLRSVAGYFAGRLPVTWEPPTNQMAGLALCAASAELLGEDRQEAPWN